MVRFILGALLAIVTITGSADAARAQRANAIVYSAPAGVRPDLKLSATDPFDAILPAGRIVSPIGQSVVAGTHAFGVALSPDGRYAIVSTDPALVVVDASAMRDVFEYRASNAGFFAGIVAVHDPANQNQTLVFAADGLHNAVRVFDLGTDGRLVPDRSSFIAIAGPLDASYVDFRRAFPVTLVASPDARFVYVVNNIGDTIETIDVRARAVTGAPTPVGYFPFGAALAGGRLLVANEGLMRYGRLPAPSSEPQFATVDRDLARASSLSIVPVDTAGATAVNVPMDQTPDGLHNVGGAHPAAVVATPDGAYAFVAMAGVDRIATVALNGTPHVVDGLELRLFERGPYGTQPDALAISHDGSRLYVALAGLNAVAVIDAHDPQHLRRLGLIPTGWYPSALALTSDDKTLYVVNAKGYGPEGNAIASSLQRVDVGQLAMVDTTRTALSDARATAPAPHNPIVPQTVLDGPSKRIKHVIMIVTADAAYDQTATPNLYALGQTFGAAQNIYADSDRPALAQQFLLAGIASDYSERTAFAASRLGIPDANQDPEDYPRAGYIFDSLARHGMPYRDYGGLLSVAGADQGRYVLDVPVPRSLGGHVDLSYPGPSPQVRDSARAAEFVRDYIPLAAAGHAPAFAYVSLPGDRLGTPDRVADGDRAIGAIVDAVSHSAAWRQTAIFILPDDARGSSDRSDPRHLYAIVVSPYAKRLYSGQRHLSTVSVLKTAEEILGLPALSLGDLLASDMADFFTPAANFAGFVARQ